MVDFNKKICEMTINGEGLAFTNMVQVEEQIEEKMDPVTASKSMPNKSRWANDVKYCDHINPPDGVSLWFLRTMKAVKCTTTQTLPLHPRRMSFPGIVVIRCSALPLGRQNAAKEVWQTWWTRWNRRNWWSWPRQSETVRASFLKTTEMHHVCFHNNISKS